jgi:hypothetical protein
MLAKASMDVLVLAFPGDATKLETSKFVLNFLWKPRKVQSVSLSQYICDSTAPMYIALNSIWN